MALFLMNDKLVCYFQKYYYTDHFPNGHLMQNFNLGPISNGSQSSFLENKKNFQTYSARFKKMVQTFIIIVANNSKRYAGIK